MPKSAPRYTLAVGDTRLFGNSLPVHSAPTPRTRLADALSRVAYRFTVTYPTKYKQVRVALPRQALRGPRVPIRTNEGLGTRRAAPQPQGRDRRRSYGNLAPLVAILGDDRS
jgi:hypothetical protein